jgi:HK97 family phage major capsid protein
MGLTIKEINAGKLERSLLVERQSVNIDERTVELAFASETPVERWYGFEILDCGSKAVDLKRLRSGGPVLVGHNPDDQVGVVEKAWVDSDKVCRAIVRFSKSVRGQEILTDIADGIRRNISVGYMINEVLLEKEKDGVATYRATSWTPYEVSTVPMPADIKVGIGRELDNKTHQIRENRTMEKCKHCGLDLVNARCTCNGFAQDERQATLTADSARRQSIIDEGEKYADKGGREVAMRLIRDPQSTVEVFRTEMLDMINQRSKAVPVMATHTPQPPGQGFGAVPVSVSLRYNPQSLRAFAKRFDRTREQEEAAFRSGMWAKAILWNDRNAQRWCADNGLQQRIMNEMGGSSGGFTVPDEMESAIVDMRLQYGVARRLCKIIPMGSAAVTVPVRTAGVTSYFVAEQAGPTNNDPTWGQAQLVAKSLKTETRFTQELEEDAVIDIGAFVVDELALSQAAMEDNCWLNGDGSSTFGGMTGLITLLEAGYATLAGNVAGASNTDTWSEIIAGELVAVMGKCPSYAKSNAKWLTSPYADSMVFARLLAAGGGNTIQTLQGTTGAAFLGYMRETCEYMPAGATTDYTNKVMALFGDFSKACLFGDRRGITVQVLRELYAQSGIISVLATSRFDINNQFAVGTTTSPGPVCALIGG